MESSEDVEVLSKAIEKLLDEKRKREAAGDAFIEDDDDQLLLSRLISQVPFFPILGEILCSLIWCFPQSTFLGAR